MGTQERLASYNFSPNVIESAVAISEYQKSFDSYQDYFRAIGMPAVASFEPQGSSHIQVVDIKPKEYDEREALVYEFPFACPPDNNMLYHLASIHSAMPDKRLIGLPGWSGGAYNSAVLSREDRKKVANGNLRPMVEGGLQYIAKQGITNVMHYGYSLGASNAVEAAVHANAYDHEVSDVLSVEPVDVEKRSVYKLLDAFRRTDKPLNDYVAANADSNYDQARNESISTLQFMGGLVRASSLAVAKGLAKGHYEKRAELALDANPDMRLTMVWGTESELALDGITNAIAACLKVGQGVERVESLRLPGKHMLVNDLALQNAIVLTALNK